MRGAGERPESVHLRLEDPIRIVERLRDAEEPHGGDRAHCVIAKGLRSPHLIALRPVHSAFARGSDAARSYFSAPIRPVVSQLVAPATVTSFLPFRALERPFSLGPAWSMIQSSRAPSN